MCHIFHIRMTALNMEVELEITIFFSVDSLDPLGKFKEKAGHVLFPPFDR